MRFLLVIVALLAAWVSAPAARAGVPPPAARAVPAAPRAVAADTIRTAVRAGEALIVPLPERHAGGEATYRVLSAPALSWLVDRSFFWQTLPSERGLRLVVFERTVRGAGRDTLVLAVEVVGG
ncbi:MAG TPA: hypothetical protein VK002_06700 [Rubricoccaceae bacterium]|jgi:hypothetical protein|nr:hypothetical protein [Rubricoccaceae bacterium]